MAEQGHPELPHPVLQAMLICDYAIREVQTNKVTLVGIFDRVLAPGFPLNWARALFVYARVTDAQGEYEIRLELVRVDDEQTIGQLDARLTVTDRVASSELIFPIDGIGFERPGRYEFRLFAGGRWVLGGASLAVVQVPQPQGGTQ